MLTAKMGPLQIDNLLSEITLEIEASLSRGIGFEGYPRMAELHYERAQIYVLKMAYDLAIEDYSACLDYDPYFYEADAGREKVYMTIKEMKNTTT